MKILNILFGRNKIAPGTHLANLTLHTAARFSTRAKRNPLKDNNFWLEPIHGKFNLNRVSDDYFYLFI